MTQATQQFVKTTWRCLFMLGLTLSIQLLVSETSIAATYSKETVSEQQLVELKQNISKIDRWLNKANTEKSGLSKELEKQEKQISKISKQIRSTKAAIKKANQELTSLKSEKKQQTQDLNKQKQGLIDQLETAYIQGKQPGLKALLNNDNPQDTARFLSYFSYINEARGEQITEFENTIKAIKKTESQILQKQSSLQKSRAKLEENKQALEEKQAFRKKVLAKLEANIKNKSQRLNKLKQDQKRLEALLREVEEAIANIPLPSDSEPFSKQKYKLVKPTSGKVTRRFGSNMAQGKLKSNGIVIASKEDAEVKAVHYGRVVFSNWIRGFGLLTIIDHGEGYMSLYGQNKSLIKEAGDWVRAGEVIAYAGSGLTNIESGLYFEIRKHGKPQNPSHWLRK